MLILDEDPQLCALSTPISMHKHILESISDAYSNVSEKPLRIDQRVISEVGNLTELIMKDISMSKKNRDWIFTYFNTMSEQYYNYCKIDYGSINGNYMPMSNKGVFLSNPLKIHSPLYDTSYERLVSKYGDIYKDFKNIIELSRLMLVHLEPTGDEFPFGVPEWLNSVKHPDYIAFDPIKKIYVKVEKRSDGYRYYTSYISDNWKEIKDVPKDIDILMDIFMSKRT